MLRSPRLFLALLSIIPFFARADPDAGTWKSEEVKRFPTVEARQGVAVDDQFFYAIDNYAIGKYRKDTGERVGGWEGPKNGHIKHLNAGMVLKGQLYCAHSNFPTMPALSSVEIWDTQTMTHEGAKELGAAEGSLTWADLHDGAWFVCFAHYQSNSDPKLSRIVKFDEQWKRLAGWSFPAPLVERFGKQSSSGGQFGPGGNLFITGHDARELYVLSLPSDQPEAAWIATIPLSSAGQAFCWDPSSPNLLYSIERKTKEVIISRVTQK